jgi:hypothetical protein
MTSYSGWTPAFVGPLFHYYSDQLETAVARISFCAKHWKDESFEPQFPHVVQMCKNCRRRLINAIEHGKLPGDIWIGD